VAPVSLIGGTSLLFPFNITFYHLAFLVLPWYFEGRRFYRRPNLASLELRNIRRRVIWLRLEVSRSSVVCFRSLNGGLDNPPALLVYPAAFVMVTSIFCRGLLFSYPAVYSLSSRTSANIIRNNFRAITSNAFIFTIPLANNLS
jgi:hypothetical protein